MIQKRLITYSGIFTTQPKKYIITNIVEAPCIFIVHIFCNGSFLLTFHLCDSFILIYATTSFLLLCSIPLYSYRESVIL